MRKLEHHYGPQVNILKNSFLEGVLARLCSPETNQPEINRLVEMLYTHMITEVLDKEFPKEQYTIPTRMTEMHPEQKLTGERVSLKESAVTVNLARAGTFPSHICYQFLHYALNPIQVRQDHIFASRVTFENHKVKGTDFGGLKVGGGVETAHVIFPDPMGATGNTLVAAVDYYKNNIQGPAKKYLALHLIVTPEYIKKVTTAHPDLVIYALRVDRGLSSARALASAPGKYWDEERGLNDRHYIVPGGGGFGEIMNNSFI
ncbi:MAG: uracil phosphoribosyltransferase [Bdellovibrionota bacterium]